MGSIMGFRSKRELLLQTATRYCEALGKVKSTILDEFVHATGYDRKYAIRLLGKEPKEPNTGACALAIKRPREPKYGPILEALSVAWRAANCICTKRLVPFLPELVPLLKNHGHLNLTTEEYDLLLSVSPATADRMLRKSRQGGGVGGISMTKPGPLLKQQIPIRTFTEWEDVKIGFFEVDTVAHCGGNIAGSFLWTLVLTDVASGWTECFSILQKTSNCVIHAIRHIRKALPFPILGMDFDNGSEFINNEMINYCKAEKITFTRGRRHRKNDQCFVEQKNGAIVRNHSGYDRFDGVPALRQMNELYRALRLYINFYQPSMKLLKKTRTGAKAHKTYSPAKTPLQRLFAAEILSPANYEKLENLRKKLDPARLLQQVRALEDALYKHSTFAPTGEYPDISLPLVKYDTSDVGGRPERRAYRRSTKIRKTRSNASDPLREVTEQLHEWFLNSPGITGQALFEQLQESYPGKYPLVFRTIHRRLVTWRASLPSSITPAWTDTNEAGPTAAREREGMGKNAP